jgi:type II secretion system protein N
MRIFLKIVYALIIITLFTVLVWFFAVPDDYVRATIEEAVSTDKDPEMILSVDELRKGLFFSIYADRIQLRIKGRPAMNVTDLSVRINPLFLIRKEMSFSLNGSMGSGSLDGSFRLPGKGSLRINAADLGSIPYLKVLGSDIEGYLSADILLRGNETQVLFEISDIGVDETVKPGLPLLATFHTIQGVLKISENTIMVKSLGLEGDKGYARVRGDITGGVMNLNLELMPQAGRLSRAELMMIERYQKSPGYYLIPIKGPIF